MEAAARGQAVGLASWWLAAPFAALALPTAYRLSQQAWGRDFGDYGPLVLAAGGWLLWRETSRLRAAGRAGSGWITWPMLAFACLAYVFGHAFGFLTLETAAVWGVGCAFLQSKYGLRSLAAAWFPLLFLALAIPVPGSLLAELTEPLKTFVSWASTGLLAHAGVPVVRQGVVIYVAQYQLLVEDACSGMNSLVGLVAVGLLYAYLVRASSPLYALALAGAAIPIAILVNILRILALVLLTYGAGVEAAEGFLHLTAGILLFGAALLILFALDRFVWRLRRGRAGA